MRTECEEYLKQFMLNTPIPGSEYKPTEEEWNRIPRDHKDLMIDMVLNFHAGGSKYQEILAEYNKKAHSDTSFGIIVKQIIGKK